MMKYYLHVTNMKPIEITEKSFCTIKGYLEEGDLSTLDLQPVHGERILINAEHIVALEQSGPYGYVEGQ